MARDEAAPFSRGETFYNGGTIETDNLGGPNLEGREFAMDSFSPDSTTPDPSGRSVRLRVVRNVSGVNLKPGRVVVYKAADPYECQVDGYAFAVGDRPAGVVDEFLPAAGVVNNDLFYIVVDGPTKVTQPHTSNSSLVAGGRIVPTAGGGASKTDDLSGRVLAQDLTGATAALGGNIQDAIGYAGEANNTVDALVKAVVHLAGR